MKPPEINSLHRSLENAIKGVLEFAKLEIAQPQCGGDWSKASLRSYVVFELLYADTYQEQIAQRDMGGKCSVFGLHPKDASIELSSRFWVSWFEEWQVVARQDLHLCTAGWSVFAGPPDQQKQQILRAEWDQLPDTGSPRSGQPHWHLDRFPRIEAAADDTAGAAAPAEAALALVDRVDGASELAGLHLAMGTWNGKRKHPECWQRQAGKTDDLLIWGVRTLEYLQSELESR
jgi:hypothetical protein